MAGVSLCLPQAYDQTSNVFRYVEGNKAFIDCVHRMHQDLVHVAWVQS